jgi:hypothetical protein
LKQPVPSVSPPPPAPIPPHDDEDEVDEEDALEDTPTRSAALTPREELEEIDVEPVSRPAAKKKKGRGGAPGSNRPLRALIAAWLGVVLFRTVALLQFEPELSLFLWPVEWVAGLAIAWLSFRRRIRAGVIVGLLGPTIVLISMGAFTAMGIGKAEGLEYLRWILIPYGVIAILLGYVVMQASRRRRGKPGRKGKGQRRKTPSTMSKRLGQLRRPMDEEDSSESEANAIE